MDAVSNGKKPCMPCPHDTHTQLSFALRETHAIQHFCGHMLRRGHDLLNEQGQVGQQIGCCFLVGEVAAGRDHHAA